MKVHAGWIPKDDDHGLFTHKAHSFSFSPPRQAAEEAETEQLHHQALHEAAELKTARVTRSHGPAHQVHFASRLNIPHSDVAAKFLPSFLQAIECLKRSDLEVVHAKSHLDLKSPHLNVLNAPKKKMKDVADNLPLLDLANAVLASRQKDTARGNKCIDVGWASDLNTK